MNELDKKLDEIINDNFEAYPAAYFDYETAIVDFKSLIKEVCEGVIGADEDLGIRISDRVPAEISSPIIERNKFRAKIRIKLNEILGDK